MKFNGNVKAILAAVLACSAAMGAHASISYQTGSNDPWFNTTNDAAMDSAFGSGNWNKSNGFSLDAFTGASFVFLDGSDTSATALSNFLSSNTLAIESFVSNGGRLFINAAPNEGNTTIDFGFGVTLTYNNTFSTTATVNANGVAAGLTTGGLPTEYTGNYFAHSTVSGPLLSLVDGQFGSVFGTKSHGSGLVAFGGQTTTNWHSPNSEAQQLLVNELKYTATGAVPEPQSLALMLAGFGIVGGVALRRRARQEAETV